ncbi:hypothetical protein [Glycomyces sp. NPDC047010]|uniref:hypothetical protein n=1 Tax=Glycomyces sp. NPDC047010 TaxID=3155023 RepID=UPI00340E0687
MYPFPIGPQAAPPPPPPQPPRSAADPVAAVAGNATMLGIGYMLMRRPVLAAAALCGTGFLVWSAAVQVENPLWRFMLPAWGLAAILHAWWLTRRTVPSPLVDPSGAVRRLRYFAVTAAALVLLSLGWFRIDAWWTVHDAEAAQAAGDCADAVAALDTLDAVHRVAFGPVTVRADEEREACEILLAALEEAPSEAAAGLAEYLEHPGALWDGAGPERAARLLEAAAAGGALDLTDVGNAFAQLETVLDETPGQAGAVRGVVEAFMADLADMPPCHGYAADHWLAEQDWDATELTEPVAAAAADAPVRTLRCGQEWADGGDLEEAAVLYREFLAEYPGHELAAEAADGVLDTGSYCADPVAYTGAPAYSGRGPHPMRLQGTTSEDRGFPAGWLGADAAGTELVVCVTAEVGDFQDSCRYQRSDGSLLWATFYAHRFNITAYELRTGEAVADYSRQIGEPCPDTMDGTYSTVYFSYYGDFMSLASEYTDAEFRGMFSGIVGA